MADEPVSKRVELIDEVDGSADGLPGYIGVGLIGGFVLGFGPLRDAVQGTGPFEAAMLRFVACLLVCVVAASFIGRILDSAPPARDEASDPSSAGGEATTGPSEPGPETRAEPS